MREDGRLPVIGFPAIRGRYGMSAPSRVRLRRDAPFNHSPMETPAVSEQRCSRRPSFLVRLLILMCLAAVLPGGALFAETTHRVYFKGTDSEVDIYFINGTTPGPTLLLLGGIQGDEPGGYLAADLYADLTLKKGNMIVVPRANFLSIVENRRGARGDMNRKFSAGNGDKADRDARVVELIKELMGKSDYFLNLHDGSGFYSPTWESPLRNPMKYGQSIIADADSHSLPDGRTVDMGRLAEAVLTKVNAQIPVPDHAFRFNNHHTVSNDSPHKEQRLSATFHALTQVGIPAFGIETSKNIADYRLRVRYQTMVVNAFLEEAGIIPDTPGMYLETPVLRYLIVSVNRRTPIVVAPGDILRVQAGDTVRIVHIEANYRRGLTARVKRAGPGFNDLSTDVNVTGDTTIEVKKDRFLIGTIPVETLGKASSVQGRGTVQPKVKHFCVRVNDRTFAVRPDEELSVIKGDTVVLLDPQTNLDKQEEAAIRIDLRGFQASGSHAPSEDRGHEINTGHDLQEKYCRVRGRERIFALQAKWNNRVFGECSIVVVEPQLEYLVMRTAGNGTFVAYPEDRIELPQGSVVEIVDVRTNVPDNSRLSLSMAGRTLPWDRAGNSGIDSSRLAERDTPLDVVRGGQSLGKVWLKKGQEFKVCTNGRRPAARTEPVTY